MIKLNLMFNLKEILVNSDRYVNPQFAYLYLKFRRIGWQAGNDMQTITTFIC
jgi:hypothetical protein